MLSTTIIDTLSWHLALKQLLHALLRTFNLNLRRLTLDAVVSFFICSSQSRKSSKASLRKNRNKYNKIQIKTYLQKTVGRNFFCSVWKSFSLSSLGSTFAVTLVENLGHSKYHHCYHALTLSLSSPEISSVSFSLLQSFPIAFDVWIWKCRVRYKSRQSVYRLSPYH